MIAAPKTIPASDLWAMPAEKFNAWRAENDYPRILQYLRRYLPEFERWRESQVLDDKTLLNFGLARFIRPRVLYEYQFPIDPHRSPSGRKIYDQDIDASLRPDILSKRKIEPYFLWAERNRVRLSRDIVSLGLAPTGWYQNFGSKVFQASVLREIELLYLGGVTLPDMYLMHERNLDFTNLDNLAFEGRIWNSQILHLIGCSAREWRVQAEMAFVDAYNSSFENLLIERARLQDWTFEKCQGTGYIEASTLYRLRLVKGAFRPAISSCDLNSCSFEFPIERAYDIGGARDFHAYALRQFSAAGRQAEAGEHAYRKKALEIRMHLNPIYYFGDEFPLKRDYNGSFSDLIGDWQRGWWDNEKCLQLLKALLKYHARLLISPGALWRIVTHWAEAVALAFSWAAWGFGERPRRVIGSSLAVIFAWAALYYAFGVSATKGHLGGSLYFSIVTFTTLGYGDIYQLGWLRLIGACEALLGALLIGLLVSALASRSRY